MAKTNEPPEPPLALQQARTALEDPPHELDSAAVTALRALKTEKLVDHLFSLEKDYQRQLTAWHNRQGKTTGKREPGTKQDKAAQDTGTEKALELARRLLEEIGRPEGSAK